MDLENDDKLEMRKAMEAAIFGNKKISPLVWLML